MNHIWTIIEKEWAEVFKNRMVLFSVIFMPLIVIYTRWAYGVMAGKVTTAYIRDNQRGVY